MKGRRHPGAAPVGQADRAGGLAGLVHAPELRGGRVGGRGGRARRVQAGRLARGGAAGRVTQSRSPKRPDRAAG